MINKGDRRKRGCDKTSMLLMINIIINVKGNDYIIYDYHPMIYILIWTKEFPPFSYSEIGQQFFINKNCQFQNCFVTNNKSYFQHVTYFDVITFNAMNIKDLIPPSDRSVDQLYVFVSMDPPGLYPMPYYYNGFFNVTYTYKLDSDVTLRFLIVRNDRGEIIGPKKDMHWINIEDMKPTSDEIKRKLLSKIKAVAWFVSNCHSPSQREDYIQKLSIELDKYDLKVDIFGVCGYLECPKFTKECYDILESDYYFYLSFENSLCEDYVSEKLLRALKHFTVPVVYGGANYTRYVKIGVDYLKGKFMFTYSDPELKINDCFRFMPKGIYLDANALEPEELAKIINDTINNKEKYYDFFKWHSHYSYHDPTESADSDEVCALCAFLNDEKQMSEPRAHKDITHFWSY